MGPLEPPPSHLTTRGLVVQEGELSHILHTVDTTDLVDLPMTFDRVTRDILARILGMALDERAWQQAKLPVAMGMRGAKDYALVAYATSVLASKPLVQALQGGPADALPASQAHWAAGWGGPGAHLGPIQRHPAAWQRSDLRQPDPQPPPSPC